MQLILEFSKTRSKDVNGLLIGPWKVKDISLLFWAKSREPARALAAKCRTSGGELLPYGMVNHKLAIFSANKIQPI